MPAATSFQVIHGEGSPVVPNRLTPPAMSISSGIQCPPDIGGSTHSMKASFFFGRPATLAAMAAKRVLHRGDELLAGLGTADGFGDAGDVGVDVGKGVRAHRDDARLPVHELAHGALHVGERHGAHLALVLREDDVGLELFQRFGVDVVDREPVLDERAHGLVDLGARAFDVETSDA